MISVVSESHNDGLEPFTQYHVTLQVTNPSGLGPSANITAITAEGGEADDSLTGGGEREDPPDERKGERGIRVLIVLIVLFVWERMLIVPTSCDHI